MTDQFTAGCTSLFGLYHRKCSRILLLSHYAQYAFIEHSYTSKQRKSAAATINNIWLWKPQYLELRRVFSDSNITHF